MSGSLRRSAWRMTRSRMAWMWGRNTVVTHRRHSVSSSGVGGISWAKGETPPGRAWCAAKASKVRMLVSVRANRGP